MPARRLGELLVAKGMLTDEQLKKALQAQMIWGGHLGTNLIELGYITEDELGEILAEAHQVGYADYEMLQGIPTSVLSAVPRGLVEKYRLVPFLFDGKKLHLVMLRPQDLSALDEVSFATGFQLIPYVTPEIRLFQILEKYYNIPRAKRYITLSRELGANRSERKARRLPGGALRKDSTTGARPAPSILDTTAVKPPEAAPEKPPEAAPDTPPEVHPEPSTTGDEAASARERAAADEGLYETSPATDWLPGGAADVPAPPPPSGPSPKELVPEPVPASAAVPKRDQSLDRLLKAQTLEQVCSNLIEEAAATFRRCAVFARSTESFVSIADLSAASPAWSIEGLSLPFNIPAVEALFGEGRTYYIGPPPSGTDDKSFYEKLGGAPPPNAFLAPIRLDDRIALVFYGDQVEEEVRPRDVDAVLTMVHQAGLALDLLALRRKDSP